MRTQVYQEVIRFVVTKLAKETSAHALVCWLLWKTNVAPWWRYILDMFIDPAKRIARKHKY